MNEGAANAGLPVGRNGDAYSCSAEKDAEVESPLLEFLHRHPGYVRIIHPFFAIDSEISDCMAFLG